MKTRRTGRSGSVFIVKRGPLQEVARGSRKDQGSLQQDPFCPVDESERYGKDLRQASMVSVRPWLGSTARDPQKGSGDSPPRSRSRKGSQRSDCRCSGSQGLADKKRSWNSLQDKALPATYGISGPSLRDIFFPTPINFSRGMPTLAVLDTMVSVSSKWSHSRGQVTRGGDEVRRGGDPGLYCRKGNRPAGRTAAHRVGVLEPPQAGHAPGKRSHLIYGIEDFDGT